MRRTCSDKFFEKVWSLWWVHGGLQGIFSKVVIIVVSGSYL